MFIALHITGELIAAAVVGGLITLFLERLLTKGKAGLACPSCNEDLPQHRRPKSLRQVFLGGWTCSACGAELDRRGRLRS